MNSLELNLSDWKQKKFSECFSLVDAEFFIQTGVEIVQLKQINFSENIVASDLLYFEPRI